MDLVRISWMKLAQKISCKWCRWMELAQGVTAGNDATDSNICMSCSKGYKMLLYCCCTKQHTHNSATGAVGVQ